MDLLVIWSGILLLSLGCIVNYLKTESRLSKLERNAEDLKCIKNAPIIDGKDIITAYDRSLNSTGGNRHIRTY